MDLEHQNNASFDNDKHQEKLPQQTQSQPDQNDKVDIKKLVYSKTKQFWSDKLLKVKQIQQKEQSKKQNQTNIREIIKRGLTFQQYLQKNTEFYRLYIQEMYRDQNNYKFTKPKVFSRKAKLMLHIFIEKYERELIYFIYPLNWVKQRLKSYPHMIRPSICIQQIQLKLNRNIYQNAPDFFQDMNKLFMNSLLYNYKNKPLQDLTRKLKQKWLTIKFKVLQLENITTQALINPTNDLVPQMMDIDEQIRRLKNRLQIGRNKYEYYDYDPEYQNQNGMKDDNNRSKQSDISKKRKSLSKQKANQIKLESCQKVSKTISRQRSLELKKSINKCIEIEMKQKIIQKRKLLKYIYQKRNKKPGYLGQQNEMNLQLLDYDEFVELEEFVLKYHSQI